MTVLPPVLTPPSPWKAGLVVLSGTALAAFATEPVLRATGVGTVLAGLGWGWWHHRQALELVERLAKTLPVSVRDEWVFREATKAWQALETGLQRAETRVQVEARLRQTLVDHLHTGVILLDQARRIAVFNTSARTLLGSSSHLELGATVVEAFREPGCLKHLEAAYGGAPQAWPLQRGPKHLQLQAVPCPDPEGLPGLLVTVEDVTRQEALETTRQKFISNASHELKSPTTGIRVAAENLLDGQLVLPEGESSLRTILRAVDRMTLLLNDIAELSRIETGALHLEPEPIALEAFQEDLLEDLQPQAAALGVRMTPMVPSALQGFTFQADPLRLHQLLGNLLSNALKFSPEGGTVVLSVEREGPWLRWRVRDEGPGIAPTEQARIFERFYRSPSARGVPGTGLGLAIVKHLAGLMNGEVAVSSELGRGSTFTLSLPLVEWKVESTWNAPA